MVSQFPKASVTHNDLKGTSAADWKMEAFTKLAQRKGIDTKRYSPIAISLYGVPPSFVTIYAVDTTLTKAYPHFPAYAESHDGKIPVVVFKASFKPGEFEEHFQQFEVVLISRLGDEVTAFEEREQVNLD